MALFVLALLLLTLPFIHAGDLPYTWLTVGRFHPVILHFPIVLIIVALLLEILRRSGITAKGEKLITIILFGAAVFTLAAIASGYLLYASGDYSGQLIEQHLWVGVITGACILTTAAVYFLARSVTRLYPAYVVCLFVSNAAVVYTSHLGGSLTHGEDYLTEYLPLINSRGEHVQSKPDSAMLVYDDVLKPVFEAKCIGCHNNSRSKGDFSMSSFQNILKGGESGKSGVVPGNADSSEVYRRLLLPEDDDDRMPPKGKTPLTPAETALVKMWILDSAKTSKKLRDIRSDSNAADVVEKVLPDLKRYQRKQLIAHVKSLQLKRALDTLANQLNISIVKDTTADEDDMYQLTMKFPPARFTNEQFHELAPFADVFSKLSLVSSGIEDDGLYHIAQMRNVKTLFLQKTNINGSGLIYLKDMDKLEVLNLSYTAVDDKSVLDLLKVPNLREVYLFQTKTSPDVIKALQAYKPTLRILMEEGPYL